MSFTTRCPTCGTMFRVVADQLKISEGWVRCGHCADVFDATLYLEAWGGAKPPAPASAATLASPASAPPAPSAPPLPAPAVVVAAPAPQPAPAPMPGADADLVADLMAEMAERDTSTHPDTVAPPADEAEALDTVAPAEWSDHAPLDADAVDRVHEADIDTLPPPSNEPEAGAAPTQSPEQEPDFQAELLRFAGAKERPAVAVAPAPTAAPQAQPAPALATKAPESGAPTSAPASAAVTTDPDAHDVPGFVRQARRRAFWQSMPVRLALNGLVLALGALLALQWAVHERDWLAARQPALKPWLVRLCEPLQCRVKPLRRIDSVVIDSSELVRRLGNFHSFDFVLKNTADVALAMPALELTLTDASDTTIARRVFLPSEWPSAPSELAAGGSASVSLRLVITTDAATPMTGYRALVFYP